MLRTRKMPRSMFLEKVIPSVSVCTSDGLVSEEKQELVKSVTEADLPLFEDIFFSKWDSISRLVHRYSTEDSIKTMFTEFVQNDYYQLLQEAVEKRQSTFAPTYPLDI